jgi:transposase
LEAELAQLLQADQVAQYLQSVPEFGLKTVAVLRAELGEIKRFHDVDQAVAYVGLDLLVRQSGRWQGQRKLSKRGSGHLRKILYMAAVRSLAHPDSAFRAYYQHLVERGLSKMSALTTVMRKMVRVAYGILKTGTTYDAERVWARAKPQPAPTEVPAGA